MGLKDDLQAEVAPIFKGKWDERDGTVVPSDDSVKLGNDAVKLNATVLYADLSDSTALVDGYKPWFVAAIYKTFLLCAAKIIRSEKGVITAYDGDRVMAVYIGNTKNTSAVRSAMKIKWARDEILEPLRKELYPKNTYAIKHVIGIDTSKLFVARTGVRGANDLVWVGRAANYAAKLAALPEDYATYITDDVYDHMLSEVTTSSDGRDMWDETEWDTFDGSTIYRSNWRWGIS